MNHLLWLTGFAQSAQGAAWLPILQVQYMLTSSVHPDPVSCCVQSAISTSNS